MAVDVFGDGVDDDVGSMVKRILDVRAQESVVHHNLDAMLVSNGRNGANINEAQGRVGRGLDPDEPGLARADQLGHVGLDGGREGDLDAVGGRDLGEVSVSAAVDVRDGDDVRAAGERLEDVGGGGRAGGEGERIAGVLEARNGGFKVVSAPIVSLSILAESSPSEQRMRAQWMHLQRQRTCWGWSFWCTRSRRWACPGCAV